MDNNFDPTLSDLVEVPPDEGPDVPNLQLPEGAPKGGDQLVRQLERDGLVEELTGVPTPSRVHVNHEPPLPSGSGTPANLTDDAVFEDEIERCIRNIAETALDSGDPDAILDAIASADDSEGWRAKARRVDRALLNKMIASADESGSEDARRVLRILGSA